MEGSPVATFYLEPKKKCSQRVEKLLKFVLQMTPSPHQIIGVVGPRVEGDLCLEATAMIVLEDMAINVKLEGDSFSIEVIVVSAHEGFVNVYAGFFVR
ncbi:hypothetical protein TNIN_320421 [Trichonephila inaurata madagascariensis]|uniref:Uncharacterized protein n=1 Tax=Trichonephila inaurata madagascariensis TaxID=2747483 RepID=A0A8X6WY06_9ARAC|nr:hypothetical protein TNIN_320421 [Trichonephila inaurata madagascariensis]